MKANWANYLFLEHDGYGRLGRAFVKWLIHAGHDIYPFTINELEMPAWYQQARGLNFDRMTVQLMPPHEMRHVPGRSVGFSMHESTNLPDGWANHVNEKNQLLLVPSPWLIEVFENAGVEIPIEVVPGGIDPFECDIVTSKRNRPFRFGCLADRGNRKSYDLAWTCFYRAFDYRNKDVELVIKCRPGSLPGLNFTYSNDPRLILWRADVQHISDVYAQMDAYICPARCEGFGMSQRESAACGVPTVVTRWSGTADDADEWAFPLDDFTLFDSRMDGCGGLWAQPSMDELCEKMVWLYEHQDEARQQALVKAQWLRDHATYAHAAQKLVDTVGKHFGAPPPERDPDLAPWDVLKSNGHKPKEVIPA